MHSGPLRVLLTCNLVCHVHIYLFGRPTRNHSAADAHQAKVDIANAMKKRGTDAAPAASNDGHLTHGSAAAVGAGANGANVASNGDDGAGGGGVAGGGAGDTGAGAGAGDGAGAANSLNGGVRESTVQADLHRFSSVSQQLISDVAIKPPSAASVLSAGRLAAGRRRLVAKAAPATATAKASSVQSATREAGGAGTQRATTTAPGKKAVNANIKFAAVEAARPILSALAKKSSAVNPISKSTYKNVLRAVVQQVCNNDALLHDENALRTVIKAELATARVE